MNLPIGKPLPSKADEPMAVEYQLHGEQNSDISMFNRHREILEYPKHSSVDSVYATKMKKRCDWGTCITDSRYPERMGNGIHFIPFPEPKQNRVKCL